MVVVVVIVVVVARQALAKPGAETRSPCLRVRGLGLGLETPEFRLALLRPITAVHLFGRHGGRRRTGAQLRACQNGLPLRCHALLQRQDFIFGELDDVLDCGRSARPVGRAGNAWRRALDS